MTQKRGRKLLGRTASAGVDTFALVRPEHLNHHGSLFGGQLLKWIDEFAWIVASRHYAGRRLVTLALDNVVFRQPVVPGAILRFHIRRQHQGRTSIRYTVDVYADDPGATIEEFVFSTIITFVSVDPEGRKCPLRDKKP